MESLSRLYAQFATGLRFEDLPPETVLQAKKSILDLLGVALTSFFTE
jgi:2-methylcitrate dehydratase PrpD